MEQYQGSSPFLTEHQAIPKSIPGKNFRVGQLGNYSVCVCVCVCVCVRKCLSLRPKFQYKVLEWLEPFQHEKQE
jgi:hypothetical protein